MRWVLMVMACIALPAFAATPVPGGKWSYIWKDARGDPNKSIRVYTYRPRTCDSTCPMMIVMAGAKRDASYYRDYWELIADRYKFLVVAPELTRELWPKSAAYNQGGIPRESEREKWTFSLVEHLFDEMRVDQQTYVLFGHGAGAQFAQRMALFRPDNRASVIVAANPGWFTMPEWRKEKSTDPFPYSLVGSPAGEAELRTALARRLVIIVADNDADPDEENLSNGEAAKRQGTGRVDRGENFIKMATAAANDLGVKLAWELVEAPDVPYTGESMTRFAGDTLYKKK